MKLSKLINSYPYCEITRRGFEADILNIEDWLENLEHIGSPGIIKSINLTNQHTTTEVLKLDSDSNSDFLNRISGLGGFRITNVEVNVVIPGLLPKTIKIEGNI